MTKPIGRVLSPHGVLEFTFITPDEEKIQVGEFIYYLWNDQKILCRVIGRESERQIPANILSDPTLDPSVTLGLINMNAQDFSLYNLSAIILGVYDDEMGFQNPRISPKIGEPVYLADDDILEGSLNIVQSIELGSAHIGDLIGRPDRVKICLDVSEIVSKHLAVLAATGSGKSYAVGVLLEEIMSDKNRGACLVFDPHGEYDTLTELETVAKVSSYTPRIKVLKSNDIKFRISELSIGDLKSLLPDLTEKMSSILEGAWRWARRKAKEENLQYFIFHHLADALDESEVADQKKDDTTLRALKWRIEDLERKIIITDHEHLPLKELFNPGQLTILQLTDVEEQDQQIIASIILRRTLKARIKSHKNEISSDHPQFLGFPVFFVVEEAHRFCPKLGVAKSKTILKSVLSEGRKFGVGVCLISQRPSRLDPDSLSQCLTQIIMKIVNPSDQKNIGEGIENVSKDLINELPALTKGQAILAGEGINTPVLIQVRKRRTPHGGVSINAPEEWRKTSELNYEERQIMEAKPIVQELEDDLD